MELVCLVFCFASYVLPNLDIAAVSILSHRCLYVLQVKELQSRLTGLVREKGEALSLKTQVEEQYNILRAQLKAKVGIIFDLACFKEHHQAALN